MVDFARPCSVRNVENARRVSHCLMIPCSTVWRNTQRRSRHGTGRHDQKRRCDSSRSLPRGRRPPHRLGPVWRHPAGPSPPCNPCHSSCRACRTTVRNANRGPCTRPDQLAQHRSFIGGRKPARAAAVRGPPWAGTRSKAAGGPLAVGHERLGQAAICRRCLIRLHLGRHHSEGVSPRDTHSPSGAASVDSHPRPTCSRHTASTGREGRRGRRSSPRRPATALAG